MTDSANGTLTCPACGDETSGNFCHSCGASLGGQFCNQCGAKLSAGAKFCSECGAGVGAEAPATAGTAAGVGGERKAAAAEVVGGQNLPWWIAGAAMFALIFMIGLSMVRPGGPPPTVGGVPVQQPAGSPPDLNSMTPVEAADRLFNRVMASTEQGDVAAAQQFLPMAIAAHQRAEPLDLDRRFHMSWLNRMAGNYEAALADAVDILDIAPDHLLGLASAAEASIELGEIDAAVGYYEHIIRVWDVEQAKPLEEYDMHRQIVISVQRDAERFLAGR